MEDEAHPLAEAEFAGRGDLRWLEAGVQEGKPYPQRIEFAMVAVDVADIGPISVGTLDHAWRPRLWLFAVDCIRRSR